MKWFFVIFGLCISGVALAASLPIQSLKLPKGFAISIYASPVPDAREMTLGPNGVVFVGTRDEGKVYAILPSQDRKTTSVLTLASGLNMPNGVAFRSPNLYVLDVDRILIFQNVMQHLSKPIKPLVIEHVLPDKSQHGWRYIRFGPDNKLYVGVGAPCNNCLEEDPRFATIMRMDADGSHQEIYAHGVRNSVGFDWDPATHQLWFTDNGRDRMGDDIPPDELNHAEKAKLHFGFPYCHGKNIPDPTYGKEFPCTSFVPPVLELPPHAASLGMLFYKGKMFPSEYQKQIYIAQHGSWNRSTKIGYDVIRVDSKMKPLTAKIFISGWLKEEKVWGRPVDILELPDGSLLISDDYANVIYRVTYSSK